MILSSFRVGEWFLQLHLATSGSGLEDFNEGMIDDLGMGMNDEMTYDGRVQIDNAILPFFACLQLAVGILCLLAILRKKK